MIKSKGFWKGRADGVVFLIIAFALLLSLLFIYWQKIDRDINHYNTSQQKLEKLRILDQDLNNFYLQAYRHLDYDRITGVTNKFDKTINFLRSGSFSEEFNEEIHYGIDLIEGIYQQKLNLIEDFKTYNARIINEIHYLYDLKKTIETDKELNLKINNLIDEVFFKLSKVFIDVEIDKKGIINNLDALKKYQADKNIGYFQKHTMQFISDMDSMKKGIRKSEELDLAGTIDEVMEKSKNQYERNRTVQQLILNVFFGFSFIILIALIAMFRSVRKTNIELSAFRYAIENSDNVVLMTDKNRKIQYVNEAFEQHTGYTKDEVIGENPSILRSELHSDDFFQNMNMVLNRGERWQGELVNRRKDGSLLYEKASIVPIFVDNELVQYLAIKLDITNYIEQQQKLLQSAAVYENTVDGIMITDGEKKILSVNPAFIHMFGYKERELLGRDPLIISSGKEDPLFYKNMWASLTIRDQWKGKINNQTKSRKIIPIWLTITVVRDKAGDVQNYIAIYTNLEEIMEMEEKADYLAYHDSLTQLPNRAHFEKQIINIFHLAKLNSEKVAILFIDLDRFKVINDTLGHYVGDEMLKKLAERIKKVLGKNDMLARIGGDEFVAILNPLKEKKAAAAMAEKILSVIKEPIWVWEYRLNTTASIGIAIYPDDGEKRSTIIKHADSAMYHAKENGKDNYKFYTEQLSIDVQTRLDLEQELKHALEKRELFLHYQPQYDLNSREISGAEALLRWVNSSLGHVSPGEFISVAEETGMIIEIGYFVFEEACREFMRWREEGLDIGMISINISSVQFRQEDVIENFKKIIQRTGISASNIEIEITERYIMEYSTSNLTILDDLRTMGCKISIDDFGTGYSSMSYMKTLAIDTIKIDRSFVMDLPNDPHDIEVSTAIIALSTSLGYQLIAEGIENQPQEDFLRVHGCHYGQGYYFSRPLDSEAFVLFAKNRQQVLRESL